MVALKFPLYFLSTYLVFTFQIRILSGESCFIFFQISSLDSTDTLPVRAVGRSENLGVKLVIKSTYSIPPPLVDDTPDWVVSEI